MSISSEITSTNSLDCSYIIASSPFLTGCSSDNVPSSYLFCTVTVPSKMVTTVISLLSASTSVEILNTVPLTAITEFGVVTSKEESSDNLF